MSELRSTCAACGSVYGDEASREPCAMTGADHRYVPEGECPDCVWEGDRNVKACDACAAENRRVAEALANARQPRSTRDELVALFGTRKRIASALDDITTTLEDMPRDIIIVTGDAPGVDLHVKRVCDRLGFRYIECHARKRRGKWAGPWAGPERNTIVARLAQRAIAWPLSPRDTPENRKNSAGTWDCVERFEARNKVVVIRDVAWRLA